jgi:hypothetical protein
MRPSGLLQTFEEPVGQFAAPVPGGEICDDQRCVFKKKAAARCGYI